MTASRWDETLSDLRTVAPYCALLVLLLLLPWMPVVGSYGVYLGSLTLIYAIAGLGLNISLGFGRLLNVAQAGLMGVSAYTVGVLLKDGWQFVSAAVVGVVLAGVVGGLIGTLAARVRTHYFLIITIGVQQAIITILQEWSDVTGGSLGMRVDAIFVGSVELSLRPNTYAVTASLFVLLFYAAQRLRISRPGRAMIGLGQQETAAASLGISPVRYHLVAMAISGLYAGVAGAMFVPLVLFLAPVSFGVNLSILLIAMVVIGGAGSNIGAVFGVLLLTFVNERTPLSGGWSTLTYGLLIMILVVVAPGGLASLVQQIRDWRRKTGDGRRAREALPRTPHLSSVESESADR